MSSAASFSFNQLVKDTLHKQASSNEYGTDDAIKTLMSASQPFNADFSYLCLCSHTLVREQSKQSNDMGMGSATGMGQCCNSISVTDTL